MQRDELERRCLAVVGILPNGDALTRQDRARTLADLLAELTAPRKIHVGGAIEVSPVAFCSEPIFQEGYWHDGKFHPGVYDEAGKFHPAPGTH